MQFGGLADAAGLETIQYPEMHIGDDPHTRTIADHVLVQSRLAGGGALTLEVAGGRPSGSPFELEIVGEKGTLMLAGRADRGFQSGRLHLLLNGEPLAVDEGELASLPDEAVNVGGLYAALRDDLRHGTRTVPDFAHAVRLTRLLDAVQTSATTGQRAAAHDWPQS